MIRWNWSCRRLVWPVAVSMLLGAGLVGCSGTRDSRMSETHAANRQERPTVETIAAESSSPSDGVQRGKHLFDTLGCTACHMVNGQGGRVGPDLSDEANKGRARAWLLTQIRSPKANNPQTIMPAYDSLSDEQVNDLTDYLLSLSTKSGQQAGEALTVGSRAAGGRTEPAVSSSPVTVGGEMWARRCGQCHNLRPPSEYSDAQWVVAVHHMRARVPLAGQEQQKILQFLQASN